MADHSVSCLTLVLFPVLIVHSLLDFVACFCSTGGKHNKSLLSKDRQWPMDFEINPVLNPIFLRICKRIAEEWVVGCMGPRVPVEGC
jgi:hypothetical protein